MVIVMVELAGAGLGRLGGRTRQEGRRRGLDATGIDGAARVLGLPARGDDQDEPRHQTPDRYFPSHCNLQEWYRHHGTPATPRCRRAHTLPLVPASAHQPGAEPAIDDASDVRPDAGPTRRGPQGRARADRAGRPGVVARAGLRRGLLPACTPAIRNLFGSASVGATHALHNAQRVIRVEQALGIFHEATVQGWFLGAPWFVRLLDDFYGTFHFVVTLAVLVVAFRWWPERVSLLAQHARLHHRAGPHRLQPLPPHAAPPAVRLRLRRRPGRELRLRGHPRALRRPVVVRLRDHEVHLQPVRGDAQPARGLGRVVRAGARAPAPASLVQGPGRRLPGGHRVRRHGDGQPLLPRRRGRGRDPGRRLRVGLSHRAALAPLRPSRTGRPRVRLRGGSRATVAPSDPRENQLAHRPQAAHATTSSRPWPSRSASSSSTRWTRPDRAISAPTSVSSS